MRLTNRCEELLWMLALAKWLTTGQVHKRFFRGVTLDAARKRLHKLTSANFLAKFQENQMHEALFRLGPEGKRHVERQGVKEVVLERRPPKQLEHFVGINDIRIAAEVHQGLEFFFACWELHRLNWTYSIIPDAVLAANRQRYALEFDRGQEGVRFFLKSKMEVYYQGFPGFPLTALLIVTDREIRMRSLMGSITAPRRLPVLFSTIDAVRENDLWAPIWLPQGLLSKSLGVKRVSLDELFMNHGFKNSTNNPLQEEDIRIRI